LRAAERLVLFINAAKPANPFDEEPDFDAFATLAKAACLMRAGELSRSLLVDLVSSGTESLSSADRDTERRDGGVLAFLFPEERRDIERDGRG
jgi:hypothetical protein